MIKRIFSSEFNRNAITLMIGTTFAQAIPFLVAPILTRIYTPAEFGVLASFLAVFGIFSAFVTLKFDQAIILPKKDEEAFNVLLITITTVLLVSLVFFILFVFLKSFFIKLFNEKELDNWLYFVPLSLFLYGLYQAVYYWFNRKKYYRKISAASIVQSGGGAGAKISFGVNNYPGGLIFGTLIGQFVSIIVMFFFIFKDIRKLLKFLSFSMVKAQIRRFSKLALVVTTSTSIQSFYIQIPILYIGRYYNMSVLGFVSIAKRLIAAPVSIIARAFGDVFRQQATDEYHKTGRFDKIYLSTLKKSIIVSIIPFILLYFITPDLFALWLGEEWVVAGEYARIIIVGEFFSFILTPVDKTALIREKKQFIFLWNCSRLVANILIVGIAIVFDTSVETYLWMLVSIRSFHYLLNGIVCYRYSLGK